MKRMLFIIALVVSANAFAGELSRNDNAIDRAVLTSAVENREPVDNLDSTVMVGDEPVEITFFTQVLNQADAKVSHLWFRQNQLMAEVPLAIGSPNWRTYSTKTILSDWLGRWRVLVVDGDQNIILEYEFNVEPK
ncbi:Protein of unknown function [Pseudidiomarina planktonica]|uniref:DUF2914 domain-containing protein n=1 Tax=Pseudidiomarina planktonica TaxID=1323738 RepID=A0A1Y6FVT8_9GAMM|nr:DUF2914 domain-containing protein [Pseudidiomarina planktonica]RUO64056.1 DUF2914 domain-containing protein [Pseudidiomarina planktonica]SMQ79836.1 Protein of unknown function [Pseudidiomarina planktonica]